MRTLPVLLLAALPVCLAVPARAEPVIVLGPRSADEAPEVIDSISGLSYDQVQRLRQLRQWLEQRQRVRERLRALDPARRNASAPGVFGERELFAPLGQRYAGKLPEAPPAAGELKLPPLPRFAERRPAAPDPDSPGARVTHLYGPPASGETPVQVEYPLRPEARSAP